MITSEFWYLGFLWKEGLIFYFEENQFHANRLQCTSRRLLELWKCPIIKVKLLKITMLKEYAVQDRTLELLHLMLLYLPWSVAPWIQLNFNSTNSSCSNWSLFTKSQITCWSLLNSLAKTFECKSVNIGIWGVHWLPPCTKSPNLLRIVEVLLIADASLEKDLKKEQFLNQSNFSLRSFQVIWQPT